MATRKQRKWKRDDSALCHCENRPTVHVHCPCCSCSNKAVPRSTELRHWQESELMGEYDGASSADETENTIVDIQIPDVHVDRYNNSYRY